MEQSTKSARLTITTFFQTCKTNLVQHWSKTAQILRKNNIKPTVLPSFIVYLKKNLTWSVFSYLLICLFPFEWISKSSGVGGGGSKIKKQYLEIFRKLTSSLSYFKITSGQKEKKNDRKFPCYFLFFSHVPFVWAFLGYVQDLQLFQAPELGFHSYCNWCKKSHRNDLTLY